jgi:hypothetical protein
MIMLRRICLNGNRLGTHVELTVPGRTLFTNQAKGETRSLFTVLKHVHGCSPKNFDTASS